MSELRFTYDPNSGDVGFRITTEGYAVIRQGAVEGQPWAVGDKVTVIPFGPMPDPPKPTWRDRLRSWWRVNRITVHRGRCHDHNDCEECDDLAWGNY